MALKQKYKLNKINKYNKALIISNTKELETIGNKSQRARINFKTTFT